jgi:hypothetical protein
MNPQVVDVEVPITSPFKTIPLQLKITGEPLKEYAIAFGHQFIMLIMTLKSTRILQPVSDPCSARPALYSTIPQRMKMDKICQYGHIIIMKIMNNKGQIHD